jgi:acid stress-induced BolA-like protein IbaG/YrbA
MDAAAIQSCIEAALPGAKVEVQGDDGVHFEACIVAPQFEGLKLVGRQRLVYAALGDAMVSAVHALSMQTRAPSEVK